MPFLDLQEHLAEAFSSHVLDDYRGFSVRRLETSEELSARMKAWAKENPERARKTRREQERRRRARRKALGIKDPPRKGNAETSRRFRARHPEYYREYRKRKPESPEAVRVRYLRRKEKLRGLAVPR